MTRWRRGVSENSGGDCPEINTRVTAKRASACDFPPTHFVEVFSMTAPTSPAPAPGQLGEPEPGGDPDVSRRRGDVPAGVQQHPAQRGLTPVGEMAGELGLGRAPVLAVTFLQGHRGQAAAGDSLPQPERAGLATASFAARLPSGWPPAPARTPSVRSPKISAGQSARSATPWPPSQTGPRPTALPASRSATRPTPRRCRSRRHHPQGLRPTSRSPRGDWPARCTRPAPEAAPRPPSPRPPRPAGSACATP